MAGIAGVAGGRQPLDHADLAHRMSSRLLFHSGSRAEHWHLASEAALCGVRADPSTSAPRPLVSDATGVCLVLFGECVGGDGERRELERLGHSSSGAGRDDALFCLRLYEAFGPSGFSNLSGSFCIAIYDPRARETLLVTDRLASRPLFYGLDAGGALIFATQVSAILEASGVDRTLDHGAVLEFCANQRVFGAKTYHRGVKIVPPASVLRYRGGDIVTDSYWTLQYRPQAGSVDDYADELASTIRRAVRRLTDAAGRTALLLSGGLDARMILAAAETELTCYTFGDYENFETAVARRVAELKGFPFHFLQRPPNHYADMVDTAVEIGSGMHPFNHAHAVGFIDRIRSECDSITHGYGTEILFRGTSLPRVRPTRFGIDMGPRLDTNFSDADLRSRMLARGYSLMGKGVRDLLTPEAGHAMDDRLAATVDELIDAAKSHASVAHDAFLFPDIYYRSRFPSFVFELSMRPYVAERSIDFDNEIIDLHLRMPVEVRCGNRLWLRAMQLLDRRVAHAVTANTGYSPFTPAAVASALDKVRVSIGRPPRRASAMHAAQSSAGVPGAGLSPISWPRFDVMIRENAALRTMIVETLTDPEALTPDLFDHARVTKLVDDHLAGRVHARHVLFALLTLGRWCKKHAG